MAEKAFLGGVVGARDMMRKPEGKKNGGGSGLPPAKKNDKASPAVDAIKGGAKK